MHVMPMSSRQTRVRSSLLHLPMHTPAQCQATQPARLAGSNRGGPQLTHCCCAEWQQPRQHDLQPVDRRL